VLNIPELERKWLHYKIKSFLPYIIGGLFLIIGLSIISYTQLKEPKKTSKNIVLAKKTIEPKIVVHTTVPKTIQKSPNIQKSPIQPQIQPQIQTILQPSMHFLSKIGTEDKNITLETKFSKENTIKTNIQPNELENTQRTNQEKSHIIIERKETKNDINEIIKRFKKNHNPALSLFIAKKYYELGDYHKAYNYALITNQINEDIEDSWIIFAKSLVKMKKKNTAVKTLREYIRYSHSSSAEILLNEILSGKFR